MDIDQQIEAEIESQLGDDVLFFAWLAQLVRLQIPLLAEEDCIDMVVKLVTEMHGSGTIVVGSAQETDGVVLIDPWPESKRDLSERIRNAIAGSDHRDRDFCFWIQSTKHFTG